MNITWTGKMLDDGYVGYSYSSKGDNKVHKSHVYDNLPGSWRWVEYIDDFDLSLFLVRKVIYEKSKKNK